MALTSLLSAKRALEAFHVMSKPSGAACNLDCDYCYFLSKEQLHPAKNFRMASEVLEAYLRQLFDGDPDRATVVVAFQGGEPTMMGLDFFRYAIEMERRFARPGQRIRNTLQTNGTLLTDEWGEFLSENNFLVGISIDGPREMHDAYRVDKAGKPTFDRVIRGLDILRRYRVEWNVLTTVNSVNQAHGRRVYMFLRDECGAEFIQFIPIVERSSAELHQAMEHIQEMHTSRRPLYTQDGTCITSRTVDATKYGQFLVDVFEEWIRRDVGRVFVQDFDSALSHWIGNRQGGVCVHAETCGRQIALERNGDVYSCDHFVEPSYRLGNILRDATLREMVDSSRQRRFGSYKLSGLPQQCRVCLVRFACNGGCPKDRFLTSLVGESGLNYLCDGYFRFFTHIGDRMEQMAGLLRQGRPAAGVMTAVAAEDTARGRNASCPCGSGRKWKLCHGARGGSTH